MGLNVRVVARVVLFVGLVGLGVARIIDTYDVNSVTGDERAQLSVGVEWLVNGTYTYEEQHPPLARVASVLLPHLAGLTSFELRGWELDGDALILQNGQPVRNLALARAGILPFFLLACVIVFLWAKEIGGNIGGFSALFIFSFIPSVLAHSGIASTDMALCATAIASMYVFWRWLQDRSFPLAIILGLFVGLCVLSKFTAFLFLPAGFLALWIGTFFPRYSAIGISNLSKGRLVAQAVVAFFGVVLIVWAGYRFSFAPINIHIKETIIPLKISSKLVSIPVPAPEILRGFWRTLEHAETGHRAYLLGDIRLYGWWYFFPIALFFKTPLPVLALAGIGSIVGMIARLDDRFREVIGITLSFLAILLVVFPSTINIGLRHVLPLFALMSIIGGIGVTYLITRVKNRLVSYSVTGVLLGLLVISSVFSHPQYIPYFNVFAKLVDGPILVDSDRDWGQAIWLLKDFVEENKIESIHVTSLGFWETDIENYKLTNFKYLHPYQPVSGWVAASHWRVYADARYTWLQNHKPFTMLGDSMLVYKIR